MILMHYILKEIPINLHRLVINYMCEAAARSNASLPYGMILIVLFKEFRVVISEEEPKKPLRHTNIYNVQILHRMG